MVRFIITGYCAVASRARVINFAPRLDTEVLLNLYDDKGEAMVNDLRGMFAFGIWDARKRALFLARDPYGIKPLYYADDGWTVRFASQVKALIAGGKGLSDRRAGRGGRICPVLEAVPRAIYHLSGNTRRPRGLNAMDR